MTIRCCILPILLILLASCEIHPGDKLPNTIIGWNLATVAHYEIFHINRVTEIVVAVQKWSVTHHVIDK